jgi:anti-sigma factor RsiW
MQSGLTCRELVEFLDEYLEDRLPQDQLARFNGHLASCPSCVSFTRSYQDTVRLGKRAFSGPDEPVPGQVPEDLVRAILDARDSDT